MLRISNLSTWFFGLIPSNLVTKIFPNFREFGRPHMNIKSNFDYTKLSFLTIYANENKQICILKRLLSVVKFINI